MSPEEKLISERLKEMCNDEGEELDPEKAAQVLFKLGKIYREKCPDKLSLIKSVGLLNAALARKPSNKNDIQQELDSLCKQILKLAQAVDSEADLLKKSRDIIDEISRWRDKVKSELAQKTEKNNQSKESKEIKKDKKSTESGKIEYIRNLQSKISDRYKKIMVSIADYCIKVMGEAPCNFCIAGMGSLARQEITPFSDFEHVIILEDHKNYKQNLDYFRWYSVIFHVIVLNLQETIVPSLEISSLNNSDDKSWFYDKYTRRGISFDGMMPHASKFPLGRVNHTKAKPFSTELIRPVKEMLKYLTSEEDRKNGYHLTNILTKTCFVFGDKSVYDTFADGVQEQLNKASLEEVREHVKEQVQEDLHSFATKFKLKNLISENKFNVKQTVYRSSTLFISALGRIHKISESSCFDIVEGLATQNIISKDTKHNLMFAVAVACEIRLKLYFDNNKQQDCLKLPDQIEQFQQFAGTRHMIKYFQIAYCLQAEISKELKLEFKHVYSHSKLLNIIICHVFLLEKLLQQLLIDNNDILEELVQPSVEKKQFAFDDCQKLLEEQIERSYTSKTNLDCTLFNDFYKAFNFFNIGYILFLLKESDDASEFLSKIPAELKGKENIDFQFDEGITKLLKKIETQLDELSSGENLQVHHKKLQRLYQSFSDADYPEKVLTTILDIAAYCLYECEQFKGSQKCCKQALLIYKKITANFKTDEKIALTLDNIGMCQQESGDYEKALDNHKDAIEIYKQMLSLKNKDQQIARVLENMGDCHQQMEEYEEALHYHKEAVLFYIPLNMTKMDSVEYHENIARVFDNVGECKRELKQYNEALSHHQYALQIYQNISKNPENDQNIARTLDNIGDCLHDIEEYVEALNYFEKALCIYENISPNKEEDEEIAGVLDSIGESHRELGNLDTALEKHNEALQIYLKLFPKKDCESIAVVYENIGECYKVMEEYKDAVPYYEEALQTHKTIPLKKVGEKCRTIEIYESIAECYKNLEDYENVVKSYLEALQIYQNSLSEDIQQNSIGENHYNKGKNLQDIKQFKEALKEYKLALQFYQKVLSDNDSSED